MSVSYNTEHKNYMVFKILEANNKIINMPDGDRIFDIRDFKKVLKNLDSLRSVNDFKKDKNYFNQPNIYFMSKAELDEEFDKFREEYNQEPRKNIRKKNEKVRSTNND
mgnify:FL=1